MIYRVDSIETQIQNRRFYFVFMLRKKNANGEYEVEKLEMRFQSSELNIDFPALVDEFTVEPLIRLDALKDTDVNIEYKEQWKFWNIRLCNEYWPVVNGKVLEDEYVRIVDFWRYEDGSQSKLGIRLVNGEKLFVYKGCFKDCTGLAEEDIELLGNNYRSFACPVIYKEGEIHNSQGLGYYKNKMVKNIKLRLQWNSVDEAKNERDEALAYGVDDNFFDDSPAWGDFEYDENDLGI